MQTKTVFFIGVLLFCMAMVRAPLEPYQYNGCVDINSSGQFALGSDLVGANITPTHVLTQACIVISEPNVELDCAGHSISNEANGTLVTGNTTGILLDSRNETELYNITIMNCRVSNYTWGIAAYLANDSVIQNNSVRLSENIAFEFLNSTRIELTDNIAYSNPGTGFSLNTSYNNTFTNNTARNNSLGFTLLEDSSSNTFTTNYAYNSTWNGFLIRDSSHDNILVNNTAYENVEGFYIYNATSTTLENNTAYNNSIGFLVYNSSYTNLVNNTGYNNTDDSFQLSLAVNNTIENNTAYNSGNGFSLYDSSYNNMTNNTAYNHSLGFFEYVRDGDGFYLHNSSSNNFVNNTAYENEGSGFVIDEESESNVLIDNTAFRNSWTGFYLYSSNDNRLTNNNASNNSEYGFEVYLSTGNNITNNTAQENTIFDLYADPLTWFYLYSEPAYDLYCNNIIENNTGSGGRPINYTNVSVNWSNIEASEIILCNADNSNLTNVTVRGSDIIPNNGLVMTRTENATIDSSNSSENIVGFLAIYSNGNSFTNNIAQQDLAGGFYLIFTTDNNLTGNIESNAYEAGIAVIVSNNTNLVNNTVYGNEYYGIVLQESSDTYLTNNTVRTSFFGSYVQDSNRTVITGDHYYNNDNDFQVDNAGGFFPADGYLIPPPTVLNLSGVIFDNPLGNLEDYTNLSINDIVENDTAYSIDWSTQPAPLPILRSSFRDKFVSIIARNGSVSIDNIIWHWTDEEADGHNENSFIIMKYNDGVGWMNAPGQSTLNTAGNYLSISNLAGFSTFGLIEAGSLPPAGGGGGCISNLNISIEQTLCPDNKVIIRVADSSNRQIGAGHLVVLTDPDGHWHSQNTNSSGEVAYTMPRSGRYKATASGVYCGEYGFDYQMCGRECESDGSCSDTQYCETGSGACKPVGCPCGEVYGHVCHPYACCANADCNAGYVCTNRECKLSSEQPQCTLNADCKDNEYCGDGKCKLIPVGQCGYIENHAWKDYQCCDTMVNCSSGYVCVNHACVLCTVVTDPSGVVGTQHSVIVLPEGRYMLSITTPKGDKKTLDTDATGHAMFVLESAGVYSLSVVQGGVAAVNVTVNALNQTSGPAENPTPPAQQDFILPAVIVLIILIIIIAIIYVLYSSRRGR